jgi:hypothetical protein
MVPVVKALAWASSASAAVLLPLYASAHRQSAGPTPPMVTFESLGDQYGSCAIAWFLVRNASRQDVHLEIYVEDLKQGIWEEAWCQYDLNDPAGRIIKRVWENPKMLKPGEALPVRYDRCADYEICVRPKYPKGDTRRTRQGLQEQDAGASPATQRIRVEVYARSGGSLKEVGRVWSRPFIRIRTKK